MSVRDNRRLLLGLGLLSGVVGSVMAASKADAEPTLRDLRNVQYPVDRQLLTQGEAYRSIEGYKAYLDSYLGGIERREAQRRLADQIIVLLEGAESDQNTEGEKTLAQKITDLGLEVSYKGAINLYLAALKEAGQLTGNEHILYQLARAYEGNAQPDKALDTLDSLLTKYPDSLYEEEGRFRRAEFAFALRRYPLAEAGYLELMKRYPGSRYYDIANYKHAWSLLKQERYPRAIASFISMMDKYTRGMTLEDMVADMPAITGGERELVNDIRRAISLSFAHQEGASGIAAYFAQKGNGRPYDFMLYQDLATSYLAEKRYQDAANVDKAFGENNPTHPQAPFFHLMMMEAYVQGGFSDLYLAAKRDFAARYAMSAGYWKNQSQELKAQVLPYLRIHLGELAQYHHAEAQRTKLESQQREAIDWYRLYLDSFPKDADSAYINFLMAELLFDTKDYQRAAEEYERTAYSYGQHERATEAGYAALLAYEEQKKRLTEGGERNIWTRKQAISAIQFAKFNRNDARVPALLTKSAQELFGLGEYENAVRVAREVVSMQAQIDKTVLHSAWLVIAHSEFELKSYVRAEASYKQALSYARSEDGQGKDIQERISASIYKQGEAERERGNMRAAASEFMRVARDTPQSTIRDVAGYDAATALIVLKDWPAAIRLLEPLRKTDVGRKHDLEITQKLIVAYTETDDRARAAAELERLAGYELDYDIQRDALWRAAQLYEKSNDIDAAIGAYSRYLKKFASPHDDAMEARQKLVEFSRKRNSKPQMEHWMRQLVEAENAVPVDNRTLRTRYLAAQAAFDLAMQVYDRYATIQLVDPIKENLKRKREGLQEAVKAFNGSADYAIAEITTGSNYMVAEIYRDFAGALMKSSRPKELNAEELEQYNLMLEEQAYPFEEKSIQLHEQNIQRVTQGIYDDWVKKSYEAMAKISPGRYDKRERIEGYVDALN